MANYLQSVLKSSEHIAQTPAQRVKIGKEKQARHRRLGQKNSAYHTGMHPCWLPPLADHLSHHPVMMQSKLSKASTLPKAITRGLVGCLGVGMLVGGLSQPVKAFDVLRGSDYLQTPDDGGTSFDFGGPIGQVFFKGVPFGPGNTDTIIQRIENAVFGSPIDIEMTRLSLISTSTTCFGADCYFIQPQLNSTPSAGKMTINSNNTFTSKFDVNFDAFFIPVDTAPALNPITGLSIALINPGANWSPFPQANSVLVRGEPGDIDANCHNPSGPGCDDRDFFTGPVEHVKFDGSAFTKEGHSTRQAENVPGPIPILGLGAAYSFSRRLRRKCRAAAKAA